MKYNTQVLHGLQEKLKVAQPGPNLQVLIEGMIESILAARPGTGLGAPAHGKRLRDILI